MIFIIEHRQIKNLGDKLANYKLVIIPQIPYLSHEAIDILEAACRKGTHLIATNKTLVKNPEALKNIFGAEVVNANNESKGNYLSPINKKIFKRFKQQALLFWNFNLGLYDFSGANQKLLPILTPGRPGPPEKTGGHEPTGYYSISIKTYGKGKAVLMPINIGRLYYLQGYEQHKNILLDIIDEVFPGVHDLIKTNVHERIEVILQDYIKNIPAKVGINKTDGKILHLINLTGFSGNAYFSPIPVRDLKFTIRLTQKPSTVFSMIGEKQIPFLWENGSLNLSLDQLDQYDGIIIEK